MESTSRLYFSICYFHLYLKDLRRRLGTVGCVGRRWTVCNHGTPHLDFEMGKTFRDESYDRVSDRCVTRSVKRSSSRSESLGPVQSHLRCWGNFHVHL